MNYITGKDNRMMKHIRALDKRSYRMKMRQFTVEGAHMVEEAFLCARDRISSVFATAAFLNKNPKFKNLLDEYAINIYTVEEKLFNSVCQTQTPQGILAVMNMPDMEEIKFNEYNLVVALDGISDAGNMGTIIRTAEAAGVQLVILLKGCTDLYNSKTVRSTMGSVFRMKTVHMDGAKELTKLRTEGFCIFSTALSKDAKSIYEMDFPDKSIVVIGSESHGVSKDVMAISDTCVTIPMKGNAESLNAAVATGIVLFTINNK